MRLRWLEAIVFVLVGALAIWFLWRGIRDEPPAPQPGPERTHGTDPQPPTPGPDPKRPQPDPPTPVPDPVPPSAREVLARAKATGEARAALKVLEEAPTAVPRDVIERAIARLRLEVASLSASIPAGHPDRDRLLATRTERTAALKEMAAAPAVVAADVAVAMVTRRLGNGPVEEATHTFFAPARLAPPERLEALREGGADAGAAWVASTWPSVEAAQRVAFSVALSRRFRAENRPRARLRWLMRAYGEQPGLLSTREELVAALLEAEEAHAAFCVLSHDRAAFTTSVWRQRAQVARWVSRSNDECDALLSIPASARTQEEQTRLRTLVRVLERARDELPLAIAEAKAQGTAQAYQPAIDLALKAGELDQALALLDEAAALADEPRSYLEQAFHANRHALRIDASLRELTALARRYPDSQFLKLDDDELLRGQTYEQELERQFRRLERDDDLVELLGRRLQRETDRPTQFRIEREIAHLDVVRGEHNAARRRLTRLLLEAQTLSELAIVAEDARAMGVEGIESRGAAMIAAEPAAPGALPLLRAMEANTPPEVLLPAARAVYEARPEEPDAHGIYLRVLDRVDPQAAAALERARALERPEDEARAKSWADRASWIEDPAQQLAAREALREHRPDDTDNVRALADLYEQRKSYEKAVALWRDLSEGPDASPDDRWRLANALLGLERYAQALALMEAWLAAHPATTPKLRRVVDTLEAMKRSADALKAMLRVLRRPDASREDRLRTALLQMGLDKHDDAIALLRQMLRDRPNDPTVLLRIGQAYAFSARPCRAFVYLSRRPEDLAHRRLWAEAAFTVAEMHWLLGEKREGRAWMRRSLATFARVPDRTPGEDAMRGKAMARLGYTSTARQVFRRTIAASPKRHDLWLDYGDTLLSLEAKRETRAALAKARPHEGETRRFRRQEAALLILEQRYERASQRLVGVLREGATDAGLYSDLGTALRESGHYRDAVCAWDAALRRSPPLHVTRTELRELRFASRPRVTPELSHRFGGADTWFRARVVGHTPLPDERWMIETLGQVERACGNTTSAGPLEDTWTTVEPSVRHRFYRRNEVFAAVALSADRSAGPAIGPKVGVILRSNDPYFTVTAQAHVDTVFDDVGAAPALGGRRTGIRTSAYHEPAEDWWWSAGASYDRIALEGPEGVREDGWATWRGDIGYRVCKSELPGVSEVSVRIDYSATRHLGDRALARVVPLSPQADFLTGRLRAQRRWARTFGGSVEVYAGRDLSAPGLVWGAESAIQLEFFGWGRLRARAAWGSNDRFQDGSFGNFALQMDLIR